ncbi:hypothetical protein P9D34_13590 [Bacillus swezeyi]|uniref:DUF4352 domain-containing protein n=1 Tax=Bacillus swezeyi TaxID=1925020 RepID=A0A1R1QPX9_9BACI|nr:MULTISPECIES: hypothetical protein [Bacillus]MEC1261466.1 hypothetical protein [Bacillus swezeyi]MED2926671.1 hypothetical protein [Bacillus swezeyi]MED2944144.1 hypothetical protein [Bacillus swezeyi]MED2965767.1 hypothetical protein [Bacillus swezeyi]MED3070830.1 hypothetical protein [Bacillus swezeyi]
MKNRSIIFTVSLILFLSLAACNNTTSNKADNEASEQESETAELGSIKNPFKFKDSEVIIDSVLGDDGKKYEAEISITVEEVIRGKKAYEILKEESSTNSKAEEGYEWALVKVKFGLDKIENEKYPITIAQEFSFDFVSHDGQIYNAEKPYISNGLEGNIYAGTSKEGFIVQQVKQGDDFLIGYKSLYEPGEMYFKTK